MAETQAFQPSGDEQSRARPAEVSRLAAILVGLVLVFGAANNQAVKLSDEFLPEIPATSILGARLLVGLEGLLVLRWGLGGVIGPPLVRMRRWLSWRRNRVDAAGVEPANAPSLPARPTTLGRDVELTELVDNLLAEPPRPTVILGAPGIGKTNLTVAALHQPTVAARYGIRRVFVRCEGSASAVATVTELAAVLGIPLAAGDVRTACLRYLAEAPAVVCLDNAETPWEADTLRTEQLFAQLVSVAGLVVSLRGTERPAGLGWAPPLRPQPLDSQAASALFLSLAPPGFDGPGLSDLLDEMGGVPLAIELLAYAAEGEGLESLAGRWRTERVKLLRRGAADHRLLSVASSVEAAWTGPLMTEPARRLLSMLGRLPNGLAHSDIDHLMPGDGSAAAGVLRRRGLAFGEMGRLRTHPSVRHHVQTAHPPASPDWERVTAHYQLLSMELGPKVGGPGGAEAVGRVAAEAANLTTAVLGSGHVVDAARGLDATHALRDVARFTAVDLGGLFGSALSLAEAAQDHGRLAQAQEDLADISLARSDHEGARARYKQALPLYRQVGNVLGEANCLLRLGDIALRRSDHEGARACYEQALPLYRQLGSVLGEANCIRRLGDIAQAQSDYEGARACYEQALPLYHQVGNVLGEANCILRLGDIAQARSDYEGARARYEEALPLHRQVGNVLGEANCIKGLGDIALARSDHMRARARYEQALPLYRQVGNVLGEANCILRLGDIALRRSDYEGGGRATSKPWHCTAGWATRSARLTASSAWATSLSGTRPTRRRGRATSKPWQCTAGWETCSAMPTASCAWATSPCGAQTIRGRGRGTRKVCLCTAKRATCSARPTASSAWATSPWRARTATRRVRATSWPCPCTARLATCSARPTASRAWATSRWRARSTSGRVRATSMPCPCTARWAKCSARPTASTASATSLCGARTTMGRERSTRRLWHCTSARRNRTSSAWRTDSWLGSQLTPRNDRTTLPPPAPPGRASGATS